MRESLFLGVGRHLRYETLMFSIKTECAHCGRPLHIEMDSDLRYSVLEQDAAPLVFAPMVDFARLKDPSIIDAF
jgi:hypothetical protein